MSIEKINQAKAEIASTSAYKTITEFFDAESFCEIDAACAIPLLQIPVCGLRNGVCINNG